MKIIIKCAVGRVQKENRHAQEPTNSFEAVSSAVGFMTNRAKGGNINKLSRLVAVNIIVALVTS